MSLYTSPVSLADKSNPRTPPFQHRTRTKSSSAEERLAGTRANLSCFLRVGIFGHTPSSATFLGTAKYQELIA
jgi:hypothetical protein